MDIILKIVHFLALSAGIGVGVSNMALGIRAAQAADARDATTLRTAQVALGQIGLVAIILLWASGLWLWLGYRGGETGTLFLIKLAFVLALSANLAVLHGKMRAAGRNGELPDPAFMKRAGMINGVTSLLAVIFAVLAFG